MPFSTDRRQRFDVVSGSTSHFTSRRIFAHTLLCSALSRSPSTGSKIALLRKDNCCHCFDVIGVICENNVGHTGAIGSTAKYKRVTAEEGLTFSTSLVQLTSTTSSAIEEVCFVPVDKLNR